MTHLFPRSSADRNTRLSNYFPHIRQCLIVFLLISLLTTSVPAAPEVVVGVAKESFRSIRFSVLSTNLLTSFLGTFSGRGVPRSREASFPTTVQIFPGDMTIRQDSEAVLSAVGFDSNGEPLSGLAFSWESKEIAEGSSTRSFSGGIFKGRKAGTFRIKATHQGISSEVDVTVLPTDPEEAFASSQSKKSSIRVSSRSGIDPKDREKLQKYPKNQSDSLVFEETWDDGNWESAHLPGNLPGSPPGGAMDGGAGNGNFQLSAPIVSLPGRGIDLALNLNYNSRVWNKNDNEYTYDIDQGWPAPGWSLGFGKIIYMGEGGCMMVDADGTRRGYTGVPNPWSNGMTFKGHTTDGSFIDYSCRFDFGNYGSGSAVFPNGTRITYSTISATPSILLPTSITDAQGNFISITYQNHASHPKLSTITDTLGRVITFHYDTSGRLIEIKAPRLQEHQYDGGKTRTVIRLHYRPLTLSHSFAGGSTTVVRESTVQVLDAIYYPATNTGYWFGDTDSYSTYGMLTKVIEQRGMSWQAGTEEQGDITAGTMTKQALYNYPLGTTNETGRTNGSGLTDAPTYTKLTESWAGRDVEEDAVTTYAFDNNTTKDDGTSMSYARSVTVVQPTGVISKQFSYRTPGAWTDGLVFTDETFVLNGSTEVLIGSSLVSWDQEDGTGTINYGAPRPAWAKVFDENGHYVKTEYTYGTNKFNQITKSCDYDNSNVLLRCNVAEYENSSDYLGSFSGGEFISGQHIFNLVTSTRVEDPQQEVLSRTDYEYDNYSSVALQNTPDVIQHKQDHNPFTTHLEDGQCLTWDPPFSEPSCSLDGELVWVPIGGGYYENCSCQNYDQVSVYDSATDKRGNITKVTTYSDADGQSGAIHETRAYDITGNAVKISSACCEETSIEFPLSTMYAYPTSQTRGAADPMSPHRMTTTATFSFETGLTLSATDANGLTTQSWYHPDTLRPMKSVSSTGSYSTFSYDDSAMTVTEEVFDDDDDPAGKSIKYLNGVGQVRKVESYAPGSIVDIVETQYTRFGEAWKQSRPYRSGDTVQWSENFYDSQRRLIKVVEPDGSYTEAFYNETTLPDSVSAKPGSTTRIVDAWGRERWGRYDQQGRLVDVVEPNPDKTANPNGKVTVAGSLLTKYKYDTIGRLVETEQGSQFRKFKYDSLGRLTRQKLAEQTATLNDAGTFVGSGGSGATWSEAFVYDSRSNPVQKTDARGVRTNFSYQISGNLDPLNRLHSRSYDTSGPLQSGLTIHNTWGSVVTYEYMATGDKTRIKKIETQGILTEEYTYDSQSRVSEFKQTVGSRENYPMTTSYLYDTLDRVNEVHYPAQYGLSGSPRKVVAHSYDSASRLSQMSYDGDIQASGLMFNAADQTTEIKIGAAGTYQVTEEYTFDPQTGLLTNQTAKREDPNGTSTLLNLSYEYNRLGSAGNLSGKTGHLTKIIDNLNTAKNREYEFDAVGRLTKAKGGATGTLWDQTYTYDRYGNRTNVVANGVAADNSAIPLDGIPNLSYDNTTNRITTTGYEYDVAGNQTRALAADGVSWVKYEYDAANRISIVKADDGPQTTLQWFHYGSTNARVMDFDSTAGAIKLSASLGGTTLAEYIEFQSATPTWTKSYTYLGSGQLSTVTPDGQGGEYVEFNHPDRLGTRLVTNQQGGTAYEQVLLPFGTALNAESTLTTNNKRFTSYDRSNATGLDYAVNRTYDSKQGRFTTVDPIGISAASLASPQTLNLYTYCGNDPINYTDPMGLFFGSLFKWVGKIFRAVMDVLKWVVVAVIVVTVAIAIFKSGGAAGAFLSQILGLVGKILGLKMTAPMIIKNLAGTAIGIKWGTLTVGLSGKMIGGAFAVGAVASNFQNGDDGTGDNPDQAWGRAFRDAFNLLQHQPCSDYITENSATSDLGVGRDPGQKLVSMNANGLIRDAETAYIPVNGVNAVATTQQFVDPRTGKVNSTGKMTIGKVFYDGITIKKLFPSTGSPRAARAMVFLHELKHALGGVHPDDDTSWTENIVEKCLSRLDMSKY